MEARTQGPSSGGVCVRGCSILSTGGYNLNFRQTKRVLFLALSECGLRLPPPVVVLGITPAPCAISLLT